MTNVLEERSALAKAALFRSLRDRSRPAIVSELASGERRVADLVGSLGLVQSTVSSRLSCLRECDLNTGRPQGRHIFYRLAVPELLDILAAAEVVLEVTGHASVLSPRYGDLPDPRA